jgi:hypothetical protein
VQAQIWTCPDCTARDESLSAYRVEAAHRFGAMKSALATVLMLACAVASVGYAYESEEERRAKQAELDAACEAAREVKLAAVRLQLTEECAEKKWPRQDRASCERYYSDYGITTPHQVGLFYDLPECVKAHDYRTSYRRSDR